MKRTLAALVLCAVTTSVFAAPLTPTITGFDFNFGAYNVDGPPEWSTNGLAPDTLDFVPSPVHTEVTAFWPVWPAPPVFPVFNGGGAFGGDFELHVMFTGQDAPYVGPGGVIDVSLTGTGSIAGGPDLIIMGAIPAMGIPFGPLWMLDLEDVSLYGYSGFDAYVLEGAGTIVGGFIAQQFNLIGQSGVMRGNLDFIDAPAGWIPPLYDPLMDPIQERYRAAYSGETGKGYPVPEPGAMIVLGLGAVALVIRKYRK